MFCTKCGAPLEEGQKFCTTCGTPVQGTVEKAEPIIAKETETQVQESVETAVETTVAEETEIQENLEKAVETAAEATKEPEPIPEPEAPEPEPIPVLVAQPTEQPDEPASQPTEQSVEPAPQPAEQPAAKPAAYKGPSQMKAFRIVTGILFLLGLIWYWLNPVKGPAMMLRERPDVFIMGLGSIILYSVVYYLLPGLLSLILCKPTRVRSIILTLLFLLISGLDVCDKAGGLGLFLPDPFWNFGLDRIVGSGYIASLNPLLPICLLWAFVSIFQPKKLVRKPAPVLARPWKVVNGIFHILGGGLLLAGGISAAIALIQTGFKAELDFLLVLVLMIVPAFMMAFSGILSISAGAKSAQNELISATAQYLAVVLSIEALILLYGKYHIENAFTGNGASVFNLVIWTFFAIVVLWYLLGTLIQFITMLASKKPEEA